ncbi:putative serine/threonine-protein kinase [Cinnamomum micranthum f. kanehirae]|uniref:Putative serine/threonine-protein kinase n=1 Tax=Cinnamomum micranthum f. kanehirae TaxID=337451 RepID=A0A3S3P363_9MAGN|nr:putative serine/threonine-protein kinase [Cinnamomum micranthum f. kanehirae]
MRSSKSFSELELEELEGFKDLGFIFNEEQLSPEIKSMLPGLQMLGEKQVVTRPYLSEHGLSTNLIPSAQPPGCLPSQRPLEADMRKAPRFWAKTVACAVNQES